MSNEIENPVMELNVGGRIFKTQRSTLTARDGFLKALVTCSLPTDTDDAGRLMINRDPDKFQTILDILRGVPVRALHIDPEEAAFYALDLVDEPPPDHLNWKHHLPKATA
eukprot:TRINITY_DN8708_c0_g1_i1.p1 TRINITY_DN8708_c0_g1~~TRINITY_DN8708_c0_g1_i1.p1  ORF type:complete len:110 (+),score=2.21 TRINITY_DN8708_c0_g1_i1:98-427(+)